MTAGYALEDSGFYQDESGLYLALDNGIVWEENFLGGVDGVDVSTVNTSFSGVNVLAGGTFKFSNLQAVLGDVSAHMEATNTAITAFHTLDAPAPILYRRFYMYALTPSIVIGLGQAQPGTAAGAQIRFDTIRQIVIRNGTTAVGTSTALPTAWVRVEHKIDSVAQSQELRLFYGANLHGPVASPSQPAISGAYTQGVTTRSQVGSPVAATFDTYYDAMVESVVDWIGPAA